MLDIELLKEFANLRVKLKTSSSSLYKKEQLKNISKDLKILLFYIYNPLYNYYVTPAVYHKKNIQVKHDLSLFQLLDKLLKREVTGHAAIEFVNGYRAKFQKFTEEIDSIFNRDIGCRVATKLINECCPNLIPEFSVALAENAKEVDFSNPWYASRKLDGVRCICIVDKGIRFFSRTGKEFSTIEKLISQIYEMVKYLSYPIIFDGELTLGNSSDNFSGLMKELKRKDHQIEDIHYHVFDILDLNSFTQKYSSTIFSDRLSTLNKLPIQNNIHILKQEKIASNIELEKALENGRQNHWEGIILRKDAPYKGKRSSDILKFKDFFDAEYIVKDVEFGPIRYLKDGIETTETMVGQLLIEHKGHKVAVGSGLTIEERQRYYSRPNNIIGKTITVQYFEETKNKKGEISLRFPTLKYIHGESRDL